MVNLKIYRYQLEFKLPEGQSAHLINGYTLTGILGTLLKKNNNKTYEILFRNHLPQGHPLRQTNVQSPFMLMSQESKGKNLNSLTGILTLFGDFNQYYSEIVEAFKLCKKLKGPGRDLKLESDSPLRFNDTEEFEIRSKTFFENRDRESPKGIRLNFNTPFRLVKEKELITDYSFYNLIKYLHRRIHLLSSEFGPISYDFDELEEDEVNRKIYLNEIHLKVDKLKRQPSNKPPYYKYYMSGSLSYHGDFKEYSPFNVV